MEMDRGGGSLKSLMQAHPFDIEGAKERLERWRRLRGRARVGRGVFVAAGADHHFIGYEQLVVPMVFERR